MSDWNYTRRVPSANCRLVALLVLAFSLQLGYSQVEKKESPDTQSELSPVQRLDDRAFEGQPSIKREHSPGAIHNSSQEGIKVIRKGILSSPESKSVCGRRSLHRRRRGARRARPAAPPRVVGQD